MTDHDVAVRAARAAFAYWCNINGIGPDDQEPEWRNNVVRRVELVGMMHAALEAVAPAIRAEALGETDAAHIASCDPDTIRAITSELLEARAEIERMREALLFYADGAPVCENDEAGGGIRTSGCKHQRCEFPECAKPQFPTWDNGGRARAALKGDQP
jgi:hypothetical protein